MNPENSENDLKESLHPKFLLITISFHLDLINDSNCFPDLNESNLTAAKPALNRKTNQHHDEYSHC